jgi:hypothetical protein
MKKYKESIYKTPILFLVFNRIDTTKKVFEQIRKIRPSKLYIASDGPRESVSGEFEKVIEIRNYLESNINWDCETNTLFRKKNLGCKIAVSSAIDWFFEHENHGIILEDDCVPTTSFFNFLEKSLNKYKNDKDIFMISGFNKYPSFFYKNHFKSKFGSIWGWGTWRDRWEKYDVEISNWNQKYSFNDLKNDCKSHFLATKYKYDFDSIKNEKMDTWDFQVQFSLFFENMFCVYPKHNLVKNIGIIGHHSTGITKSHNTSVNEKFKFKKQSKIKFSFFYEWKYLFDLKKMKIKSILYKFYNK